MGVRRKDRLGLRVDKVRVDRVMGMYDEVWEGGVMVHKVMGRAG